MLRFHGLAREAMKECIMAGKEHGVSIVLSDPYGGNKSRRHRETGNSYGAIVEVTSRRTSKESQVSSGPELSSRHVDVD